jgi:hypothetical protein
MYFICVDPLCYLPRVVRTFRDSQDHCNHKLLEIEEFKQQFSLLDSESSSEIIGLLEQGNFKQLLEFQKKLDAFIAK